jgi:hypothetical protein
MKAVKKLLNLIMPKIELQWEKLDE